MGSFEAEASSSFVSNSPPSRGPRPPPVISDTLFSSLIGPVPTCTGGEPVHAMSGWVFAFPGRHFFFRAYVNAFAFLGVGVRFKALNRILHAT